MNTYIIPICDIQAGDVWDEIILAGSIKACEEKLMSKLIDQYDELEDSDSYVNFVIAADKKDILIGKIKDIETL